MESGQDKGSSGRPEWALAQDAPEEELKEALRRWHGELKSAEAALAKARKAYERTARAAMNEHNRRCKEVDEECERMVKPARKALVEVEARAKAEYERVVNKVMMEWGRVQEEARTKRKQARQESWKQYEASVAGPSSEYKRLKDQVWSLECRKPYRDEPHDPSDYVYFLPGQRD